MQYYLALKRTETLTHATTWVHLEWKKSVTRRQILCYCIPLIRGIYSSEIQRGIKQNGGYQGWGGGVGGNGEPFHGCEKAPEIGGTTMCVFLTLPDTWEWWRW